MDIEIDVKEIWLKNKINYLNELLNNIMLDDVLRNYYMEELADYRKKLMFHRIKMKLINLLERINLFKIK